MDVLISKFWTLLFIFEPSDLYYLILKSVIIQYIKLTNINNNSPSYITGNSVSFEPQTNINRNNVVEVKNHNIHVLFCGSFEYVDIILRFSY